MFTFTSLLGAFGNLAKKPLDPQTWSIKAVIRCDPPCLLCLRKDRFEPRKPGDNPRAMIGIKVAYSTREKVKTETLK